MKKDYLIAGILGLVAAIIYFASLASYAFPGQSAHLLVLWKGLESSVGEAPYPLMAVFARLLGGGNLIAPICGIVSVVLLFVLVRAFILSRVTHETLVAYRESIATIAATVSAVIFMLSPAVRSAATHLEPRLFDFMWVLLSFAVVLPLSRTPGVATRLLPLVLGIFVALGLCDSVLFLVLLPFYIGAVVISSLQNSQRPFVPVFLFLFSFFVAFLVALFAFDLSFVKVFQTIGSEFQSYSAASGWLFVLFFATLPFLIALFSSKKAFGEMPIFSTWIFHAALSFVSVLAIATPLSPSSLMEAYGVLPVTTSAFAAVVAGYVVAFWWAQHTKHFALAIGGIYSFVLVVSSFWNLFAFNGDEGAFADNFANKIIDDLDGRSWFISDGLLDDHLKLVANERDVPLHIVSLARDDEQYLEQLSALIEKEGLGGEKNSALRLSASLGVLPFIQDWFASDSSVAQKVVIFGAPDIWYSSNRVPVPEILFFGADESRQPDWSVWKELDQMLEAPKGWGSYHDRVVKNPAERLRFALRRHVGFVANNRGVYLQDKNRTDEAFAMYELVLNEIDHDNICAIFNEVAMVGQKHPRATAKRLELERVLKSARDDKNRRYVLWRLGVFYGYIRDPEIFVRLGYTWARSGRPGDALAHIRRAIDFLPSDRRNLLMNMMASLYASENEQVKSRQIYESVLEKDDSDHDALIGLMRLELMNGNSSKALEYLQRALAKEDEGKRSKVERAIEAMLKNDLTTAKDYIRKAMDLDPKDLQILALLATVTMQQIEGAKDEKTRANLMKDLEDEILPLMEKRTSDQLDYYLQAVKGFVLLRKGKESRLAARDAFASAVKARPDIASTRDMMLGLDISLNDRESAVTHAKEILRRNLTDPLANYVLGSVALQDGDMNAAEIYLRKAADAANPVPAAMNDLAEVLRRKQNLSEAERYARLATEKFPGVYVAWETLGSILMDAGKGLDEAEASIRRACDLSKGKNGQEADIRMLISLARVQIARKDNQRAKLTIRKVRNRISELSDYEREEFERIAKTLK